MKKNLLAAMLLPQMLFAGVVSQSIFWSIFVDAAIADDGSESSESPLTVDLGVDFYSDYMFRGQNLYPGSSIQPSIAPNFSLGDYGNLSSLTWMHFSADGASEGINEFFEYDQTFAYDISFDLVTLSVGHVWYTYPDNDEIPTTAEIIASVSVDTLLSPTLTFYHEYREYEAQYYEVNLSHKFDLEEKGVASVTPFVNMGFATNSEAIYGDADGYVQTTIGVSAEVPLGPLVLQPRLAYTAGEAELTVDEFYMGFSLLYSL